jgi:hypothetical protein
MKVSEKWDAHSAIVEKVAIKFLFTEMSVLPGADEKTIFCQC